MPLPQFDEPEQATVTPFIAKQHSDSNYTGKQGGQNNRANRDNNTSTRGNHKGQGRRQTDGANAKTAKSESTS